MVSTNLIEIESITCFHILIYRGVKYLRKPQYGSHARDPMYHPMKMVIARLWKCYKTGLQVTSNFIRL